MDVALIAFPKFSAQSFLDRFDFDNGLANVGHSLAQAAYVVQRNFVEVVNFPTADVRPQQTIDLLRQHDISHDRIGRRAPLPDLQQSAG
jgi:hypothetical protein